MNNLQRNEEKTIYDGNLSTPKLNYSELLDLMCFHMYISGNNERDMSYPLANICIIILQQDHSAVRKDLASRYMVAAFRLFIRKWVMRNYNRIRKFFNTSIQGTHQDMSDIYQEIYIHFFDLVYRFNTQGDVYFVVFLGKYLYYYLSNKFKLNKKEKVNQISLESLVVSGSDGSSEVTMMEALDVINARPLATGVNIDEDIEESWIEVILIQDFERTVINCPEKFKDEDNYYMYKAVYTYFFVDKNANKSQLAREMNITQQKVRYYLDKIYRMFYTYIREV